MANGKTDSGANRMQYVLFAVLLFVPGCYEKSVNADRTVYGYAWWVGLLVIATGLLAAPLGLVVRHWNRRLSFGLIVLGPFLLTLFAPAIYLDRVVVDAEHFETRDGLWMMPTEHSIRFDDMSKLRYVTKQDRDNRINYELHCVMKDGDIRFVHAGDLVRHAAPDILSRAKAKHIEVSEARQTSVSEVPWGAVANPQFGPCGGVLTNHAIK